jgi:hypothetical protein
MNVTVQRTAVNVWRWTAGQKSGTTFCQWQAVAAAREAIGNPKQVVKVLKPLP